MKYLIICLSVGALLSSCMPPMEVMAKPGAMEKLRCAKPVPASPVKVSVRGQVQWNGKSASIANGYFTKRLKNAVSMLDGFSVVSEKEADLKIHVTRNNKFDRKDMNKKIKSVMSKKANVAIVDNDYDQWFTITGAQNTWKANVPHGLYFIYGDKSRTEELGFAYDIGGNQGMFKSLVLADEAMLYQVVSYALKQAQLAGCYR